MLNSLIKRAVAYTTPWVFNQHSLPGDFKELKDQSIVLNDIKSFEPGFKSAYESVINFYIENNLESLKECLEPNLFNTINKNFTELQKNNIHFRRVNSEPFEVTPLSFSVHFFLSTNRSLNPAIDIGTIAEKISDYQVVDKLIKKFFPKDINDFIESFNFYYSRPLLKTYVVSVELAFYGRPPLGVFEGETQLNKPTHQNEYHVIKFEGEVQLSDFMKYFPPSINDLYRNINWSICDIDNILKGNELLRPEIVDSD